MIAYLIETERDDNGTLLVTCPAFPEVTTFAGPDHERVTAHALAAIQEAIAARISDGDPLPAGAAAADRKPTGQIYVRLPLLVELKVDLYMAMRETGTTRAALARRLDWHREQVDRLFRLDHASRVNQLEEAFEALHRNVDVTVREVA
jgi:antitoxin HicB